MLVMMMGSLDTGLEQSESVGPCMRRSPVWTLGFCWNAKQVGTAKSFWERACGAPA